MAGRKMTIERKPNSKFHETKAEKAERAEKKSVMLDQHVRDRVLDKNYIPKELSGDYAIAKYKDMLAMMLRIEETSDFELDDLVKYCNLWASYGEKVEVLKQVESKRKKGKVDFELENQITKLTDDRDRLIPKMNTLEDRLGVSMSARLSAISKAYDIRKAQAEEKFGEI